jgi:2-dehydropantoate 2-reductase
MNIAVIGIGGVGGYFGGKLALLAERDTATKVYFVARGEHLKAIRASGLELDAEEGRMMCRPTLATDSIADLPRLDICILCVKGYDLLNVLEQLKDKIDDDTAILPLLNGVDIYERAKEVLHKGYLHPSCVYISASLGGAPGKVRQRGPLSNILFGADPARQSRPGRPGPERKALEILEKAGIKHAWKEDPFLEIWNKYLFIAPFGLVTADSGKTIGEVIQSPEHLAAVKRIMGEILSLAKVRGVALPPTAIEDTIEKAKKFPFETKTSFQRDVESPGKPDERDLFGGSIIRLGKELGVPTPGTQDVFASIARKKPL